MPDLLEGEVMIRIAAALSLSLKEHAPEDGAALGKHILSAPGACNPVPNSRQSAHRGCCRATTAHVRTTPCELGNRPHLEQAMVATMPSSVAVIRQCGRRRRRRGRCRRRCWRATFALSRATEHFLPFPM